MDLFVPVVEPELFHLNFSRTLEPSSASVRQVLMEWATNFVDRDRKFVKEFQTTYNSGFWEFYLFAVLRQLGIDVDFSFDAPDFVAKNHPIAIEAAIASHAFDDVPEWEKTLAGITDVDILAAYEHSIIRLSNTFLSKSNAYLEKYSKRAHMSGRSFIIAIGNFSTQDFNLLGDVPMQWLLYDLFERSEVTKANGSVIPLGIFNSAKFAHVSGVMFSGLATFGKARALSHDDGDYVFNAIRIRNNIEPIRIIAKKSDYNESLTDGLRLFINPYANNPIDVDLFEDPGIRKFVPHRDGGMKVSCHESGDLCMRQVTRLVERGSLSKHRR